MPEGTIPPSAIEAKRIATLDRKSAASPAESMSASIPAAPAITALSRKQSVDINAIKDDDDIMRIGKSPIPMSSITIRNLDPAVKERLRIRAARHGHSMEAEARHILQSTLQEPERPPERTLYERIRARFEPLGGIDDLDLPPREPAREPPRFD
jgi:plasmid stability protein